MDGMVHLILSDMKIENAKTTDEKPTKREQRQKLFHFYTSRGYKCHQIQFLPHNKQTTTSQQPVVRVHSNISEPSEPKSEISNTQKVHLISLGCPKNRVDSEVMVGKLYDGPYTMVDDPESVDVVIVNTCSFIQPATEESIETMKILQMGQHKEQAAKKGQKQKLIVTGCMVQRFGSALEEELPEVDFFLGTGRISSYRHCIEDVFKDPWIHRFDPM